MNTCKTCKWWGHEAKPIKDWKSRQSPTPTLNLQCCRSPALLQIDEVGYSGVPSDGFGLDYPVCDLVTGPDFGCTKWEGE